MANKFKVGEKVMIHRPGSTTNGMVGEIISFSGTPYVYYFKQDNTNFTNLVKEDELIAVSSVPGQVFGGQPVQSNPKFKVGERVRVNCPTDKRWHGLEVEIIGVPFSGWKDFRIRSDTGDEIEAEEKYLEPLIQVTRAGPYTITLPHASTGINFTLGEIKIDSPPKSASPSVCKCSSSDIFNYGCRCGAFNREMGKN